MINEAFMIGIAGGFLGGYIADKLAGHYNLRQSFKNGFKKGYEIGLNQNGIIVKKFIESSDDLRGFVSIIANYPPDEAE